LRRIGPASFGVFTEGNAFYPRRFWHFYIDLLIQFLYSHSVYWSRFLPNNPTFGSKIMPERKLLLGIAGFLAILFSLALAQPASPPVQITPDEIEQAKKAVQTFCAFWKAQKFDSLYVMMGRAAQADMPKAKFIKNYSIMPDNAKKLSSFSIKAVLLIGEGIIVRATLTFVKENPPSMINGVHNIHLVKEKGIWKIKAIVPPISPPKAIPGQRIEGSHPGE
jgi:hypothetical protein